MLQPCRIAAFALAASLAACTSPFDDSYDAGGLDAAARADANALDAAADTSVDASAIDAPAIDAALDTSPLLFDAGADGGTDGGTDAATTVADVGLDAHACTTTGQCGAACIDCLAPGGLLNVTGPACATAGTCDYAACTSGFSDCDGARTNGCERAWSPTQCGPSCTSCASTVAHAIAVCSATGACDYTACSAGFLDCDGNRANGCERAQDVTHCGASCTSCTTTEQHATGASCTASGTCDFAACAASYSNCDGIRTNGCETSWNASHCGAACSDCTTSVLHASATCSAAGTCDYGTCSTGYTDCNGNRADGCERAESVTSCGASCANCTTGFLHGTAGCTTGACSLVSCNPGYANCNASASDGCETMTPGTDLDCCEVSCYTPMYTCQGSSTRGFTCRM